MSDSTLLSATQDASNEFTHCIHCNDTIPTASALLVCTLCREELEEEHEHLETKKQKPKSKLKVSAKPLARDNERYTESSHPLAEGDKEWYAEMRYRK